MKTGLNFDAYYMDKYEQWKKDREEALSVVVIKAFCETSNDKDPAAEFVHDFLRELLIAAGHSEGGLQVWELLSVRTDHES